jgi:hypothetical protein
MANAAKKPRKSRYFGAIIINVVLIWVFANLLNWGVPFLTSDYSRVLWAIDLSLAATILANILFLIFDPGWFRHLLQVGLNIISIIVGIIIFLIFPFTFARESWAIGVKVVLIVIIVGIIIGTIAEFIQFILRKD